MANPIPSLAALPHDYAALTAPRVLPEGYQFDPFLPLPSESEEAFADFCVFRDLGVTRTLSETIKKVGKTPPVIHIRSKKERWHERVAVFDKMVADEQRAAISRSMEKYADDLAIRRMQIVEEEWEIKAALRDKFNLMMKFPIAKQEVSKDGKHTTIIPAKWSFYTAVQMAELISTLGRRVGEMPTTHTQVDQHFTDHTQGGIDMSALTPEQRAKIEALQMEMAAQALEIITGTEPDRLSAEIVVPADHLAQPPTWYPGPGALPQPPQMQEGQDD